MSHLITRIFQLQTSVTGVNGDDIYFWRIPTKCPGLVFCCLTIHLPFTRLSSEMLQVQVHLVFGYMRHVCKVVTASEEPACN